MSLRHSSIARRGAASCLPRLETLEGREVPAVASWQVTGGTMIVNCDNASDTVVVTDNGTGGVNNITVNVNGIAYRPSASIWELRLNTNGGHDRVTYNLTQPLRSDAWYHELELDLGEGNDTYDGYVPGISSGASGMNMYINGRGGDDALRSHIFGTISSAQGGGVGLGMTGGFGRDVVTVDQIMANGYRGAITISSGAMLWANLHGYEGWTDTLNSYDLNNTVALSFQGELDGRLSYQLMGAGGRDSMSAVVNLNRTSTGYLGSSTNQESARILGGGGNDSLYYYLYTNGAPVKPYHPHVVGGAGLDYFSTTSNVYVYA